MEVKLLGSASKEFIDEQLRICAGAGKLSRMKGKVQDALDSFATPEEALKFIKRVIKMGHTSTIDHDYMVFALSEVSPAIEQTIIAERFSSFTIKSRREVDFRTVGFYTPDFHDKNGNLVSNNDELKEKYNAHMRYLFDNYSIFVDNGINKEDARFVLPYSYHAEIIMGLDATALARMIISMTKGVHSNVSEFREFGEKLKAIAETRAPYLETVIENSEVTNTSEIENILDDYVKPRNYKTTDKVELISYTKDVDNILFINAISRIYGYTFKEASKIYKDEIDGNEELKKKLMKAICEDETHEDLKQVNFRFNLSVTFAVLTHYTRHRRLSLSIPAFVPNIDVTKYLTPPCIEENEKLFKLFKEIFKKNAEIYNEFLNMGIREEDLIYFTLSGNLVNITINFDGEALRWICRLRMCTKAQWCIRYAVNQMHDEVAKVSKYFAMNLGPDCVTKHKCGEGKESCGRINAILKALGEENEQG